MVPVTSAHVRPVIAAPLMGLVPTSPVTFELGTSLTPDFDRMAKEPAAPTLTGNRVLVVAAGLTYLRPVSAWTTIVPAAIMATTATGTMERVLSFTISPRTSQA